MRYGLEKKRFSYIKLFIGLLLITASLNLIFRTTVKNFNNSVNLFAITEANFQNTPPAINFNHTGIKVVVYIGESTSVMNMGLYGYPRNTTPYLDKIYNSDENFLRFKNVFSTHTYTSQSLLEALSVNANNNNDLLPITLRKRISLIDILNNGNISSYLYSNQGATGSWNLASAIIFKNAYKKFSTQSVIAGNADNQLEKPSDDVFFEQNLTPNLQSLNPNKSAVLFLHSYSGHGEYLNNIPASFRQPVDDYINSRPANAIVGANFKFAQEVEHYDSAIKYIDFSIAKTIGQIKKIDQPVVLIYFSDHGDSAYSARGHEVGKFQHEMARVPFILYFNGKARVTYPQLFEKYKALSEQNNISTLAQLPATIIDILGGDIENSKLSLPEVNGADNDKNLQPLGIRETAFGKTYIDLTKIGANNDNSLYINVNDDATNIFVAANTYKNTQTKICYGNVNTIGKALRGALVSDCLELDVNITADKNKRPEEASATADIRDMVEIAQKKNLTLWLKAQTPDSCKEIANVLGKTNAIGRNMLVEFPGNAYFENSHWLACIDTVRKLKGRVAYNVPTDKLLACAQAIESKPNPETNGHCQALESDLQNAEASRLFNDFAFDYAGISAMENSPAANKLSWNIRNVAPRVFNEIKPERFNKVAIINGNDPNDID
ncbi:MAG: sulfatase-like hydrolase/transferase [Methylobacter sp.]